ncbi:MAG: HDOD domain-containing protein [Gammaproteobacteria bacterium]|nr:HDOD domain-containing protein [Gammaproteobacteria bacterium]MCW9003944.1 HDOD domain-containing protein [Gammaproteobacteria bacterium]
MSTKAETFFEDLKQAVESDQLVLPTLPEVALKIRDAVESENTSAQQIAETLTQDASLSARLIQVANSPLYRSRTPIEDLQMAVTRLGIRMVRDLVISLAMKQIYQATSDVLDERFRDIWGASVEVAAICRMLATTIPGINPEQALLAGLIHNIGSLPVLLMAEDDDDLFQDANALTDIIWEIQGKVGELILKTWNFPDNMTEVVKECHNFDYDHVEAGPNLVDIVQVALLQGGHVDAAHEPADWNSVPAFAKLGMDTEVNVVEMDENQEIIENTKQSLLL